MLFDLLDCRDTTVYMPGRWSSNSTAVSLIVAAGGDTMMMHTLELS